MSKIVAKPFLKWAGSKRQLIRDIEKVLPHDVIKKDFIYIEPFVGSGAVLFWILNKYSNIKKAVINDINEELINVYKTIASKPNELISILRILQNEFYSLSNNIEAKKEYYYSKRELYNSRKEEKIVQSALFIFLNKTCFNGLYRVNRNNEFNVPMGSYKKPIILDERNILAANEALQKVEILCGDYENTLNYAEHNTLFYLDPPYKPLSKTSNFNSYSQYEFDDKEQIRLSNFCDKIDKLGHKWILSNSDVELFDILYSKYDIKRVKANRCINSNPKKRGAIYELLITNTKNN